MGALIPLAISAVVAAPLRLRPSAHSLPSFSATQTDPDGTTAPRLASPGPVPTSGNWPIEIPWRFGFATAENFPVLPGFVRYRLGPDGGTIWQGAIPNLIVPGDNRQSDIYLPPDFSTAAHYPVLYLLHGTPGSPSSYVNGLHVAKIFDTQIARGRVRPFIAVIPPAGLNAHWLGEWTGNWESYVVSDVVPWVDAHLPTLRIPEARAIAGLSAGGYGAVDIGLRHPRLFGTLEAWSGYFTAPHDGSLARLSLAHLVDYDPSRLVRLEAAALRTSNTRFFISCATTRDPITAGWARDFNHELSRLRLRHRLLLLPGGHDGTFWLAQLPAALAFAEPKA